jgi:hypothetical protein
MNLQLYAGVIASKGLQEKIKPGLMKKKKNFCSRKLSGHERQMQDL